MSSYDRDVFARGTFDTLDDDGKVKCPVAAAGKPGRATVRDDLAGLFDRVTREMGYGAETVMLEAEAKRAWERMYGKYIDDHETKDLAKRVGKKLGWFDD